MKKLLKKVAIITIATLLLLMNIPPSIMWNDDTENVVQAAAPGKPTGSSGSYLIDAKAESVPANPSVYWTQIDDLSFTAVSDGGTTSSKNSGNNEPVAKQVKNTLDLTTYTMPTTFVGSDGKNYSRSDLSKVYLKNDSVRFKNAMSFKGISLTKVSDTKFAFLTETGSPNIPTKKEKYGVNSKGQPKYSVRYDTPIDIVWYGQIDKKAEMRVVENSTLPIGAKKTYKAQVRTQNGNSSWSTWKDVSAYQWISDKTSVATVSSNGEVTTKAKGDAKITATWKDDNFHLQASATVKVTAEDALSITGTLDACLKDGSTTLKATLYKAGGKATDVTSTATWSSSDTSIATVSKGVVTFKKVGSTVIKATAEGKTESVTVTVIDCTVKPPPDPTEPEQPKPPANEPPTVEIEGPSKVVVGEWVCYKAIAEDPDGFIELYEWDEDLNVLDATNKDGIEICGKFKKVGVEDLIVKVRDNGNEFGEDKKWDYAVKPITVVTPQPTAYVKVDGTLKENRLVTVQPYDAYNDNKEAHVGAPITKQTLTIEALEDEHKSKVLIQEDITGNVVPYKTYSFLGKFSGDVKITSYVENSLGENDTFETVITLVPDVIPTIDFDTPTLVYREPAKNSGQAATVDIQLNDLSYSTDDEIQKRIWRMKYDSNNDGNFDDEEWKVISDANERNIKYNTAKVGKYLFELEIFEKFSQPTIPQFVDQTFNKDTTDLRFNDTSAKAIEQKIVEVDNLAPLVSLDAKEQLVAEIQFDAINSPYPKNVLEGNLPYLKNLLAKENINLKLGQVNIGNRVKQVASAMYNYAVYLMEDGTVYGIGQRGNFGGIPDDGSDSWKQDLIKVNLPSKVKQVETSLLRTIYLMEDGSVYGVGDNDNGELGNGTQNRTSRPVKVELKEKVRSIYAAQGSTIFITENGKLFRTGLNQFTGSSSKASWERSSVPVPVQLPGVPQDVKVKQVALGDFAEILTEDGSLYRMKVVNNSQPEKELYVKYTFPSKVKKIIADATYARGNFYILEDGSAYAAGYGLNGNLGIGSSPSFVDDPVKIDLPSKVINISTNGMSSFFVLEDGSVYSTGYNSNGVLGDGTKISRNIPKRVILPLGAIQVSAQGNPFYLMEDGSVYAGGNLRDGVGIDTPTDPVLIPMKVTNFDIYSMYSNTNATLFNVGLNQQATLDYYKRALKDTSDSYFVGAGTTTKKSVFDSVVSWNENRGEFIQITPTNTNANVQKFYDDLAKYIISVMGKKVVEVQYDIANSPYNESQIRSMNSQLNSLLNDYNLRANVRFEDPKIQTNQPLYSVEFNNKSVNVADTLKKLEKTNAYYVGGGTSTNKASMDSILSSHNKGTFINIGTSQLETVIKDLAAYIIQTQSDNAIEIEFLLDEANGVNKATLETKINSVLKKLVAPDGTDTMFRSKITVLSNNYNFKDVHLDGKNRFVVSLKTNGYDNKLQDHIKATNLVNNAYFVGLGSSSNEGTINQIVQDSMKKGTFIEFNNLDATLTDLASYIISTVDENRGINELYITTEDELEYFTTYNDFERDPIFADYWKFNHDLGYFESESNVINQHGKKITAPIKKFNSTGRYQPHYAAQDDPLIRVFASESIETFKDYRKWSEEADNWRVFVHKMPTSEFTFTLDKISGAFTVKSTANDSDKKSIDVGFGAGLQSQKFSWKLEDETDWKEGLPIGNLDADKSYNVRNTVIDFQNKKSVTTKTLSRINLPPVAVFETDKLEYEVGKEAKLTNSSYDPNDDDMTATWYIKKTEDNDSTYKQLSIGSYENGKGNQNWNTVIKNLSCDSKESDEACSYTIKLFVKDKYGDSDETTRVITVYSTEIIEVGIEAVEVFTAPAKQGLPTYIQINEELLIENKDQVEDARSASVQITVNKNGKRYMENSFSVKELTAGVQFTILPSELKTDSAYDFEFLLSSKDESVVISPGAEKISLNARTAEEKTISSKDIDLTYKGLVSVKRSINTDQVNMYETIRLKTAELMPTVTGLGHSLDQTFKYDLPKNQHYYSATNLMNISSNVSFDEVLIDTNFDATNVVDGKAIVNTINTDTVTNNGATKETITQTLSYPKVYVESVNGNLYSENQKSVNDSRIKHDLIDGGHKLYIPIWLDDIGKYDINYETTSAIGVNKVKFAISQELDIEAYLFLHMNSSTKEKDKFLIEPVNKKNSFPNGKPVDWSDNDVEWIRN